MSSPGSQRTPANPSAATATVRSAAEALPDDELSPESRAEWAAQQTARPRNKRRQQGELVSDTSNQTVAGEHAEGTPKLADGVSAEPASEESTPAGEPAKDKSDTAVLDTATPDTATPDTATPDTAESDTAVLDTATPDTATPDTAESDTAVLDTAASDTAASGSAVPAVAAPDTAATGTLTPGALDSVNGPTGTVPVPVVSGAQSEADQRRVRRLTTVSVAAVLLIALTVIFGVAWNTERDSGPTANQAFVDSAATSALVGQVTSAVVAVYSYNYATLPANEAAAKAVITGKFAGEFERVFGPVKQLAPGQQAVVRTTVPAAAVSLLQGNRARLLMMVNQTGTRGPDKQPTGASARLVVDAIKVDGQWKISEVTPE